VAGQCVAISPTVRRHGKSRKVQTAPTPPSASPLPSLRSDRTLPLVRGRQRAPRHWPCTVQATAPTGMVCTGHACRSLLLLKAPLGNDCTAPWVHPHIPQLYRSGTVSAPRVCLREHFTGFLIPCYVMAAVGLGLQAFKTDVNSLPLSLVISWFEQKAVAVRPPPLPGTACCTVQVLHSTPLAKLLPSRRYCYSRDIFERALSSTVHNSTLSKKKSSVPDCAALSLAVPTCFGSPRCSSRSST